MQARSSVSMQTARAFSTSLTVKKGALRERTIPCNLALDADFFIYDQFADITDFVQEIYLRELKAYKAPAKVRLIY